MSSYFDALSLRIGDLPDTSDGWDAIRDLELSLVQDVTVAALFPGLPANLADAIHRAILRHGVYSLPPSAPPADFETFADHQRRIHDLCQDLHSIFHEVGRLEGWSDHPLAPLRRLGYEGNAIRERMARSDAGLDAGPAPETAPVPTILAEASALRSAAILARERCQATFGDLELPAICGAIRMGLNGSGDPPSFQDVVDLRAAEDWTTLLPNWRAALQARLDAWLPPHLGREADFDAAVRGMVVATIGLIDEQIAEARRFASTP